MNGIMPGLLYYDEDVKRVFTDNGYTTPPLSIQRVNCQGSPATLNGLTQASGTYTYYCSYFFRENNSSFQVTSPETTGAVMPYFFGQSKLCFQINQAVQGCYISVVEYCFSRFKNDGTAGDGSEAIGHLNSLNGYRDMMKGDLLVIESKGNTRYWMITLDCTDATGALGVSMDSFWSGVGGIDRQTR